MYLYYLNNGPEISYNYSKAALWAYMWCMYINNAYRQHLEPRQDVQQHDVVSDGITTSYGMYVLQRAEYYDASTIRCALKTTTGTVYGMYYAYDVV
jgi:hypothetical protein